MNTFIKSFVLCLLLNSFLNANEINSAQQVFRTYCWGCHHQTSMAFGPSFAEIASKRTVGEIQGHIVNPKSTFKQLGYKRSVMPAFGDTLSQKEIDLISNYILEQKGKE